MATQKGPTYLTPDQLCARWRGKKKPGTLRNWRFRGIGPKPTKIGKAVLYLITDVEEWERANAIVAPAI